MTEEQYLIQLKSKYSMKFEDLMQVIEDNYNILTTAFKNGDLENSADENQGSAKLFAFAKLHNLNNTETLRCFGQYYQEVLDDKNGSSHSNIRQLILTGLENVILKKQILIKK
ncbi:Type III effector HopPmaJ [hydrothermal vent metagenome]|uniref:Type III effector HopPmaJ n=1 Tax=hydrothermal vent metagenome TaxID=652676 RepID=A0A1W1CUZ4_9ZZZZ